jgi:hypothetical protein
VTFVVLVAADSGRGDGEVVQQLLCLARVLAGDAVYPLQHVEGTDRDIAQVPNGSGYKVETRRERAKVTVFDAHRLASFLTLNTALFG